MVAAGDLSRGWIVGLGVAVAALICGSVVLLARLQSDGPAAGALAADTVADNGKSASSTSVALAADPAVTSATVATTVPAVTTTTATPVVADRTAPFRGMGTWVDVFEWAPSYASPAGSAVDLLPSAVDRMAAEGVQVLYLQATRFNNPTGG